MTYNPRDYWTWRSLKFGPSYVGPRSDPEDSTTEAKLFNRALNQSLGKRNCGILLDFGCGSGRLSKALGKHGRPYLGVDISSTGIDQARWKHPDLHFYWMDKDRIPLPDGTVTTVVAAVVFQHIVAEDEFKLWTSEIKRVVNDGAAIYVIDSKPLQDPAEHMRPRPPSVLSKAFSRPLKLYRDIPGQGEEPGHWFGRFMNP